MAEQLGTEPDADLTMIQPEKTSTDLAYEGLVNSAKDRSAPEALTQAPTTAGETMDRIGSLQDAQSVSSSMRAGNVDPDLDRGKSMFESVESARARNQSNGVKALKAIGGGILQGGLIVAEEAGYVIDMDTYTNLFTDTEDLSGNAWTRLMKDTQESLRESEAFKIYEEQPDPNSVTSQIFKWGSLEGAISSAVGFGVTGLGAAKLVSYLGTAKKFKDLAKYTDLTLGNLTGKSMQGATKAFTGPLATSAMSNYFMGQMMGTDTYNQAMVGLKGEIDAGRMTEREAQELASNEAQDVVALNMALSATAYIKFGGIFKRKGRFNGLVENPTALNQMKNLIKAGSPTAFTENVYQEMIQMEQLYDVDKRAGIENASSDNYWDRMTNLAMSNRALHAGALGVVGGPIQFAVIQRPMMGKQIAEQREAFKEQTALVGTKKKPGGWNKALVDNNFDIFRQYEDMAKTALVKGEFKEAEFIDDVHVLTQLSKNVEWGTSSILRKDMQDIAKMTPEQAAEQNYGEDYKEVAANMLETLDRVDMYTKAYAGAPNKGEIIHNRVIADRATKELQSIEKAVGENLRAIGEELKTKFPEKNIAIAELTGEISINRLAGRFDGLSEAKSKALKVKESTEDNAFNNYLKHSHKVKNYFKGIKGIKKYSKFKNDLFNHYTKISNPAYQTKFAKEQETATKNAKDNAGKVDSIVKEEEGNKDWMGFKELEAQPPRYTKEELEVQQKEWDKEAKASKNINRNESFSAMDPNGVVRTYTPGDLVRSQDGRVFKIVKQVMTQTKSGQERFNMPLMREVTDQGKWIESAPKGVILEDNMFLRDEAKQLVYNKAGVPMKYHEKTWGQYLKTDSLLKANDVNYQASLLKYADEAQVVGINVSANRMKSGDFRWMDDYQHHTLNLPFPGEYEVVYKLKEDKGEHYIDVYKKTKGTASDVKITRLSREGNLNHQTLLNLLATNKGEITGKAVGHFSSRANLLKNYGEDGTPIFSPLSDLNNIDPAYLINGKMIIAQTKGDGPNVFPKMNVARDSDGNVYADEFIDVLMPNGKTVPKEIPFTDEYGRKIMQPGDSYALILSPKGDIVPILLSSEKIESMPSLIEGGETFVDDVTASWNEAIQTWLAEEIANQEETDTILKKEIEVDDNVAPDKKDEVFADRKAQVVWNKNRDTNKKDEENGGAGSMYAEFKKTILTHIRLGGKTHTIVGEYKGQKLFNQNKKKQRIINPMLLRPGITVAKATGEFVPSIEVQHPQFETKTIKYNPIDTPNEWKEIIGRQRKRTSIDLLADTSLSDKDGKAAMQNLINAGGLKVDIDTTTPYVGSSGTFTVDGQDFGEASAKVGQDRRKYLRKAFKGFEEVSEVLVEASESTLENFNEDVDSVLSEENPWLKETINEVDDGDVTDVIRQFNEKVIAMDIVQSKAAQKMLKDIMEAEKIPGDLEAEHGKLIEQLEDRGIGNNQDMVARGILGLRKVQETVNDTTSGMNLKDKQRVKSEADPTGKWTQPEDRTFSKGVEVYHAEFGAATFQKIAADGRYILRTKKGNKTVRSYPGDTFIHDGTRANLAEAKHAIAKLDEAKYSDKAKALKEKIIKLETKVTLSNKVKTDPVISTSDSKLYDLYTELRADKSDLDAVKLWGSSNRTEKIHSALSGLKIAIDTISTGTAFTMSEEVAEPLNDALLAAVPYQAEELQLLVTQAEVGIKEGGKNAEQYKSWKARIKSLIKVQEALSKGSTEVRTKIEGERYLPSKQTHATQLFYVPAYVGLAKDGKGTHPLESTAVIHDMNSIAKLIQRVTIAEAGLQATHFVGSTAESIHKGPIKAADVKKEPIKSNIVAQVDNRELDEYFGPRATLDVTQVKRVPQLEQKIVIKKDTIEEETSEQPAGFEDFKLPSSVSTILEFTGTAKKEKLKADLAIADSEGMDLNIVYDKFIEDYDSNTEAPFKKGSDVTNTPEAFAAEVKQVKAMLPQIPIEQVESVTKMVNKFGLKAIGAYHEGVNYVVKNAKAGTVFHEGFHAVASLYLTNAERAAMAKEKGEDKWSYTLEETLADDFAVFAKDRKAPGIGDKIKKFFQSILDWFSKTRSQDVTTKIFEKIASKGYAKSKSLNWQQNVAADFNSISTYKERLSKKNSVLLQTLIDTNKIEIVC